VARFIPAPDLWNPETRADLDAGRLTLQPGQWVRCGGAQLSRFYRHNRATGHVVAFHGPAPHATRKLRAYVASGAAANARRAARGGLTPCPTPTPAPATFRVVGAILRRL
jgi:hypothetical protein